MASSYRYSQEVVGLVPARGGSKSVPLKNIKPLAGRPLIDYSIVAGQATRSLGRVFCSTDNKRIAEVALSAGATVIDRPAELATDSAPVSEAISQFLRSLLKSEGVLPAAVALLQPTSPFILPEHIDAAVAALADDPEAQSVLTVTVPPHNHHAYNQRELRDGYVRFRFEEERRVAYNKQRKPKFFVFGNLILTRSSRLIDDGDVFAAPCVPLEIPFPYAADVDMAPDFDVAEWYLSSGKVVLDHL